VHISGWHWIYVSLFLVSSSQTYHAQEEMTKFVDYQAELHCIVRVQLKSEQFGQIRVVGSERGSQLVLELDEVVLNALGKIDPRVLGKVFRPIHISEDLEQAAICTVMLAIGEEALQMGLNLLCRSPQPVQLSAPLRW
jgi:hypothetical protein